MLIQSIAGIKRAELMAASALPAVFDGLNAEQQLAATLGVGTPGQAPGGPLLVIAGAGTGKTNVLAHRVAYLLVRGVAPQRIVLLTFSRRASAEMLRRAELIVGQVQKDSPRRNNWGAATRQLWSGTFHAIGNRLLREYAPALGLQPNFSVVDRGDAADLMDMQRNELGLARTAKRFPRKDTCLAIYSHRVNTGATLDETLEREYPWCSEWASELQRLFRRYVEAKQVQQLLDYDDLLLYWHLLMQQPAAARDIAGRFDHVLVDEYQDTNILQAQILHALKPDGSGLCVVGDDAQSIYSFRAATVDNILSFPGRFEPPARTVTLEQNYRSVQPILDAANALMGEAEASFEKHLHSSLRSQQRPRLVTVEDDRGQAEYVVEQVLARREEGTLLRHQAVLMRKSQDSDVLEVELMRRDIPFVKYGGLKFLEAAHVKDLLSLLRFADNPRNRLAGFRVLQLVSGVGPASAERCLAHLEEHGGAMRAIATAPVPLAARADWPALTELLLQLASAAQWAGQVTLARNWYEPHLERLHGNAHVRAGDLLQLDALATQHGDRESFLTGLTLDPPQSTGDEAATPHKDEDYLILSTVHSAKGQEWDCVYTLNVVDGTFPNEFATESAARIEEERRLLYVAMTRAKYNLELIAPLRFYVTQQRRYGERHLYGARSRFLTEGVLATLEQTAWAPAAATGVREPGATSLQVDAGAQMRAMWDDQS
ncbi:MAG: DNA helicase-2/ATP-dependent DNA helicase PcrA [Halieaceae bacterium]|jgi:DNA helicase-2/ATP-dependent DNA helicase PcrA